MTVKHAGHFNCNMITGIYEWELKHSVDGKPQNPNNKQWAGTGTVVRAAPLALPESADYKYDFISCSLVYPFSFSMTFPLFSSILNIKISTM